MLPTFLSSALAHIKFESDKKPILFQGNTQTQVFYLTWLKSLGLGKRKTLKSPLSYDMWAKVSLRFFWTFVLVKIVNPLVLWQKNNTFHVMARFVWLQERQVKQNLKSFQQKGSLLNSIMLIKLGKHLHLPHILHRIQPSSAKASSPSWAELSFNPGFSPPTPNHPTGEFFRLAHAEAPASTWAWA